VRPDEAESCVRYQVARITRQVDRWVTGAKSHPDERWRDVNFLRNTIQELDDALNYIDGHLEFNTKPRRI
jgi:hypothetical protein